MSRRILLFFFPLLDMGFFVALPMLVASAIVMAFCGFGCYSIVAGGYPRLLMLPCMALTLTYCFPHFIEAPLARIKESRRGAPRVRS
jgi:hypothetical protein